MAKIVLQPCRFVRGRISPSSDPVLSLSWEDLCKTLAPAGKSQSILNLRKNIRTGVFTGLLREAKNEVSNFVLISPDRTNKLNWLLKRDPTFSSRLVAIYKVLEAIWDSSIEEQI